MVSSRALSKARDQSWFNLSPVEIDRKLASLGLHLHRPEPAIICQSCKYSLQPLGEGVSKYLGSKHKVALSSRKGLDAYIEFRKLPNPNNLALRHNGSAPHIHLAVLPGVACRHCDVRSINPDVLRRHVQEVHLGKFRACPRVRSATASRKMCFFKAGPRTDSGSIGSLTPMRALNSLLSQRRGPCCHQDVRPDPTFSFGKNDSA